MPAAQEGHGAHLPRVAADTYHGFFNLFEHAAVEVGSECGLLFFGFVAEEVAVSRQGRRHLVLAEEFAQDAFFGNGGLALPVTLQQLFYVFIVHSFLFFRMFA